MATACMHECSVQVPARVALGLWHQTSVIISCTIPVGVKMHGLQAQCGTVA